MLFSINFIFSRDCIYQYWVAINNEEYVPTIIPISIAKINPLIDSPNQIQNTPYHR
jgi:hypothetical protein